MRDTFLNRLIYVLLPFFGGNLVDRAGTFIAWVGSLWVNGTTGQSLPPPPAGLPAWVGPLLVMLSTLLTAYHVAHPETGVAVARLNLNAAAASAAGSGAPRGPPPGSS